MAGTSATRWVSSLGFAAVGVLLAAPVIGGASPNPGTVTHVPGTSQKICQLTGDEDRHLGQPTLNRTASRFGVVGTDLGASLEHQGRIYFLFGDTPGTPRPGQRQVEKPGKVPGLGNDSIAFTEDMNPEDCLEIQFVVDGSGRYLSPSMPEISLTDYEVPVSGFSNGESMYVFFVTDRAEGDTLTGRSILARTRDGGQTFQLVHTLSQGVLLHVTSATVESAAVPGLPTEAGQGVLIWGSGNYRQSNPRLAYAPLDSVENRPAYRFFSGLNESGVPLWSEADDAATDLFNHPCIGELSVAYVPSFSKWLMLYNCNQPPGIHFSTSDTPWGPWSAGELLFNPRRDGGRCTFIHVSWQEQNCDSLHGPGRENVQGGAYGPYIIAPFMSGDESQVTIYYLMSTWNPYQVVLMRSVLSMQP